MNPYQPPAQYPNPQNTYPVLQQEPQARYPQLPPIDKHQNTHPQYPQYPQHPQVPQANQNSQQGYVPPSQYALMGANPVIPDSRTLLTKQMKDIDRLFEKGLLWVKLWLNLMLFVSGLTVCYAFFGFGALIVFGKTSLAYNCFAGFAVLLAIWLIMQCFSQKRAIEKKDLFEANKALSSIYWFAFFYLIYVVSFIVCLPTNSYYPQNWFQLYFWSFVLFYVLPVWVHIAGTRNVRNLLEKRDALALELDPRYGNNL